VRGNLLRPVIWAEQVKQHRHAPGGDTRRLGQSKQFLNPHRQNRRLARFVLQGNLTAAGHHEAGRRVALDGLELRRCEQALDEL